MTDIVERLRILGGDTVGRYGMPIAVDAADEIERLRQRIKELEAIKKSIADMAMKNLQELAELRKALREPVRVRT